MDLENPTSLSLKALSIPLPRTRMWRGGVRRNERSDFAVSVRNLCVLSPARLADVAWDSAKSLRIVKRRGRCLVVR